MGRLTARLCILFVWLVLCPLATFADALNIVNIDGRKAAADRVIARTVETGDVGIRAQVQALPGVRETAQVGLVPGLVVISLEEAVAAASGAVVTPEDALIARIKTLRDSGLFSYVEPDWLVRTLQGVDFPDDAAFEDGRLWGLRNEGQNGGIEGIDVNVVTAWPVSSGDPSVIVGVVDTGIRYTHNDLQDTMWVNSGENADGFDTDGNGFVDDIFGIDAIRRAGDPIDRNGHGTHVAGTIAAAAFSGGPHVGVAYDARVMALKFLNDTGWGFTSDAIIAIDYAVDMGAHILNNSWGGGRSSRALLDSIRAANDQGVLFIAAAGNDASDIDEEPAFPASYDVPNVISVAAIDRNGDLADFSNYGLNSVHIAAPGVAIFSTTSGSDSSYGNKSGTSMAAPHVAGVAALLKSAYPDATITELRNRLLATAAPLEALEGLVSTGGMVDAEAALTAMPDGILALSARPADLLVEGQAGELFISVSDLFPVTGAIVTASFDPEGPQFVFADDGIAPDRLADDEVYTGTVLVPEGINSLSLTVNAEADGKEPAEVTFDFEVFGPPANNRFANREVLLPGTTVATGSNFLSDSQEGEPLPFKGGRTVWWQWNAPENGNVTISTYGSDFDTTLAVFVGDSLGGLLMLASNDDASGTFQSEVTFYAQAGRAYHLQVDGVRGAQGDIVLRYPGPGSLAPGGVFIRSQPEDRTVRHGRNFTLTVDAGGQAPLAYQWYRLDSEDLPVAIPGANAPSFSVNFASVDDAGSYFVEVSNGIDSVNSSVVEVAITPPGADLPANDDFIDARLLENGEGALFGSNVDATAEPGEPNHAGVSHPQSSTWYTWIAPDDGFLRVDTFGSSFDTVLAVYHAGGDGVPSINNLLELAANDDAIGTTSSALELDVQFGQQYYIAVSGFGGAEGLYTLSYAFLPVGGELSNDAFEARISLPSVPAEAVTVFGSNVGASGEADEPNHAGVSIPLKSVWWSWQAPASGPVHISTEGSNFDTTLAVYRGSSVPNLTLVVANDDAPGLGRQSAVSFTATAGQVYAIAVDGFGSASGNIRLTLPNFSDSVPDAPGTGILLVDAFGGFGTTATKLRQLGYSVTVKSNEFNADYPSLRDLGLMAEFRWVIFAPRDTKQALSRPVLDALQEFVERGGHLLVTGYDSLSQPIDTDLAALLGLVGPGDLTASLNKWHFADIDHPILNGPVGDFRGTTLDGQSYDLDTFTPAPGTLVLATLGDGASTPRLTFRPHASGGSTGYWNGGWRPASGQAQPDFTIVGPIQSLFVNYAHFVMQAASSEPRPSPAELWIDGILPPDAPESDRALEVAPFGDGVTNLERYAGGLLPGSKSFHFLSPSQSDSGVLVFDFNIRADDPRLSAVLEWSPDLRVWSQAAIHFDAVSSLWSLEPAPFVIEEQVSQGGGIWRLYLRPTTPENDTQFLRLQLSYEQP